jgi:hypothetical protein
MPLYQNTSVDSTKLIIGNYKVEYAPYSATTHTGWVNLGAGKVNSFGHTITEYDVQAGNAPDPIEGISEETFNVDMEMIEYTPTTLSLIQGGAITVTQSTASTVIHGGGNAQKTAYALRLTNRRMISGATVQTVILVFKVTANTGLQFTVKSDNDADPINVMPVTFTGKIDGARTVGSQLYTITRDK